MTQKLVAGLAHALQDETIALRLHEAEFQIGRFLNLCAGVVLVGIGQARQLNEDAVVAGRLDDGLGHAEPIHALAQHFRGLGQSLVHPLRMGKGGVGISSQVVGVYAHQERCAALQIQTELNPARRLLL